MPAKANADRPSPSASADHETLREKDPDVEGQAVESNEPPDDRSSAAQRPKSSMCDIASFWLKVVALSAAAFAYSISDFWISRTSRKPVLQVEGELVDSGIVTQLTGTAGTAHDAKLWEFRLTFENKGKVPIQVSRLELLVFHCPASEAAEQHSEEMLDGQRTARIDYWREYDEPADPWRPLKSLTVNVDYDVVLLPEQETRETLELLVPTGIKNHLIKVEAWVFTDDEYSPWQHIEWTGWDDLENHAESVTDDNVK